MGIILGIIFGSFVGWIAKNSDARQSWLRKSKPGGKWLSNLMLGAGGGVGGDLIMGTFGHIVATSIYGIIATLIGAITLILLSRVEEI